MKIVLQRSIVACGLLMGVCGCARAPINVIWPFDTEIRWFARPECSWDFTVQGEGAVNVKAYNDCKHSTNVLQLWQESVSSLAMIRGFPENSYIGQVAAQLNGVPDDGIRGHMVPCGSMSEWDVQFAARYFFRYGVSLGAWLPVYSMSLHDISWFDQTKSVTVEDLLTKSVLTNNFVQNVATLSGSFGTFGKNQMNIGSSWRKTGFGDLAVALGYARNFPQYKELLRNVAISAHAGLTFPTGLREDDHILMPIPYGSDGSMGGFFGLGVELQWFSFLRGGVQADFWKIFGDKRHHRIKTDGTQSDLVLLANVSTYTNWAVTRRYTLYGEIGDFERGYSFGVAYHYFNKGEDSLVLSTNEFSSQIANDSMHELLDWKLHDLTFMLSYNYCGNNLRYSPRIMIYFKNPFRGERVLAAKTFGVSIGFDF
jgi:hypothetical protein